MIRRIMRPLAVLVAGALGVWLGMHAVRAFLVTIAFNVAEDVPAIVMALVGLAIWLVGLAAGLPARLVGPSRAAPVFGGLFAALVVARQAVADEVLTAVFAIGAVVVWLWWLPAFVSLAARRGAGQLVVPAVIVGLTAQLAGQVALHGLDVHVLAGPAGTLIATALAGAFVLVLALAHRLPAQKPSIGRWGAVVVLPYLFLQFTLLANIGRLEALGGWDLPVAGLVGLTALVAASAALLWAPDRPVLMVIGTAAIALVLLAGSGGIATLAVVPAQAGLAVLLAASFRAAAERVGDARVYIGMAVGGILFFALLFAVYYDFADSLGPIAWPLAAFIVALPSLRVAASADVQRAWQVPAVALVVSVAALAATAVPPPASAEPTPTASGQLVLVNYNIHQGIGRNGVPALPRAADVIASTDADIITLQEVNRVWNLGAGVDSFAWLQRRLTRYEGVYGEMHGVHFGNAIFSRYPIREWGTARFPMRPGDTPRAYVWALVATDAGDLLVVTSHLTPYSRADEAAQRDEQAALLLELWREHGGGAAVFTGDYNEGRDAAGIRRTVAGGLVDSLALHGLADDMTFFSTGNLFKAPSAEQLDYVFTAPEVEVIGAQIIQTDASDHLPLLVTLKLR
jgi:endonuclease/exonuclease/phosphatase family metal-dependent hydrolase